MGVIQAVELTLTIIAALSAVIAATWARAAVREGRGAQEQLNKLLQREIAPVRPPPELGAASAPRGDAPVSPAVIPDGLLREDVRAEINALAQRWHTTPLFVLRAAVAVQLQQTRRESDRESGEVFRLKAPDEPEDE